MSKEQCKQIQMDKIIEGTAVERKFTKAELAKKLQEQGVTATGNINTIRKLCSD